MRLRGGGKNQECASSIDHFQEKHLVILNKEAIPGEDRATLMIHDDLAAVMDQLL